MEEPQYSLTVINTKNIKLVVLPRKWYIHSLHIKTTLSKEI